MLSCGLQRMTHPQIDAAAIGVGGDSAGGNLASAVALKARDEALCPPLAFQLLAYPCNDRTMSGSSCSEFAQGYGHHHHSGTTVCVCGERETMFVLRRTEEVFRTRG